MQKIIFLIVMALLFASCESGNQKNASEIILHHDVVVMVDDTEGGLYQWSEFLKPEDLVNLFIVDGKEYCGSVTFTDINDVSLNRVQTAKLAEPIPCTKKDATKFTKTLAERKNQKERVKSFLKISNLYKSFVEKKSTGEKKNSILYMPITKAINRLAESKADKKTLIILSDMIENSECGNFYRATACNYQKVIEDLVKCSKITITPNSGVKVIVLFRTTSPEKDKYFVKSMEIWDLLFKKAGISYEVLPNL